jgi:hypothetical protein
MLLTKYERRFINGKEVKTKKVFSRYYIFIRIPYSVDTLNKIQTLNLSIRILDVYVYSYRAIRYIEVRIYKQKSMYLIAFLYNFFKEENIENLKIIEHTSNKSEYLLLDMSSIKKQIQTDMF